MAKKKIEVKEKPIEVFVSQEVKLDPIVSHVVQHLDRDPNDPRNRPDTKALPSLDD